MKNSKHQLFNGILIIVGASLLAYSLAFAHVSIYFQLVGLVLLMFGAYRASAHWARHKDDHLDE